MFTETRLDYKDMVDWQTEIPKTMNAHFPIQFLTQHPYTPTIFEPLVPWLRKILKHQVRSKPGHASRGSHIFCRTFNTARANVNFWTDLRKLKLGTPSLEQVCSLRQKYKDGRFVGIKVRQLNEIHQYQGEYQLIDDPTVTILLAGLFISGVFDPATANKNYCFPIVVNGTPNPFQLVMSRHPKGSLLGPHNIELAENGSIHSDGWGERSMFAVVWKKNN